MKKKFLFIHLFYYGNSHSLALIRILHDSLFSAAFSPFLGTVCTIMCISSRGETGYCCV